jgi:hypothetical protein
MPERLADLSPCGEQGDFCFASVDEMHLSPIKEDVLFSPEIDALTIPFSNALDAVATVLTKVMRVSIQR